MHTVRQATTEPLVTEIGPTPRMPTKQKIIAMSTFDKKLQHSIELLQKSEELALRYSKDGFFLAFSGEKTVKHYITLRYLQE